MVNKMKYIITIGRQYGSGGRFIGKKLAEKLNIAFYDNELLAEAATSSGMSPAIFENYDEKRDGFFSGLVPVSYGLEMSIGQKVFLAQFDTIRRIAENESCVIVGRCADYVLRDNPNVISVFIQAPLEDRINRVIKYYNIKENKAEETIRKMDKKRSSYYSFYTDKKWGKADGYDLAISSSIGIDECVDVIINYVEKKLKTKF